MNHFKDVLQNGIKLFTANTIRAISSLTFIIVATRLLNKEEMALVALIFILSAIICLVSNLGLGVLVLKLVPEMQAKEEKEEVKRIVSTSTYLPVLVSAICGGILLFFYREISLLFLKSYIYGNLIRIVTITAIFCSIYDVLIFPLYGLQMFGEASIVIIIANVSQRLLAILFYFIFGLEGIFWGFGLGALIGILYIFYQLKDFLGKLDNSWYRLVKYSLPFYATGVTRYAIASFDKLIIGILLSPAVLAVYFVAERIPRYCLTLIESVTTPTIRKLTEFKASGVEKVEEAFKKTSRYISLCFIPFFLGLISIGYPLLHLYAGKQYVNGFPILVILLLSLLMYAYYALYSGTAYIMGEPKIRLKYEIVTAFSGLIFIFLLVPIIQTTGVALAKFLSFVVGVAYTKLLLKKLLPGASFDFHAIKPALFSSLPPFILLILLQIWYYRLWIVPFYFFLGASIFFFISKRGLKREDIELLENVIPLKQVFIKKLLLRKR